MWPWGHLAVAYLLYSVYHHRRGGSPPRALPVTVLAIGSQFPDLIDKPFAWTFGVLPGGRTLTHSVFAAALLLPVVYGIARRVGHPDVGTAFAVGHVSHLLADVPPAAVFGGDLSATTFLFWPVLEPPAYESVDGILAAFLRYSMGWYEWAQLGLVCVALVLWYRDGTPGLGAVRRALGSSVSRSA
ncbi:metal-dependent hydrolase [Natrinema salaciae]|uniref:LexA-binding, inner membrane-associated putative hydrolase n=1 Tax=Natrinema salaciae TaxID=1186196 RepID=A0A1H9BW80_9EURY|nr:metal-dependent hydrolase [Natrinema salaciae]SEP93192.1 LexA-binding, inner membrane-associated putative hydrolase [Natrinema salaciae]